MSEWKMSWGEVRKKWHSPIEAIYHDVEYEFENDVLKAIQKVDIVVDRDELVKALNYDRGQYEKGYADGKADAVKRGRWIEEERPTCYVYKCTVCGDGFDTPYNYCPNCGAHMVLDDEDRSIPCN